MSRFEIAELERELRDLQDVVLPVAVKSDILGYEDMDVFTQCMYDPEFVEYNRQLKLLVPVRHATIKRYFDKFKMQKSKRDDIIAAVEATEPFFEKHLGPDYEHYQDAIPEIRNFLDELRMRNSK
jgi:hypothetical protein